ncbi:MAG: LysM peptidoglycan-binding domain-containing protein [Candidatus Nanopelagicales bacterium]
MEVVAVAALGALVLLAVLVRLLVRLVGATSSALGRARAAAASAGRAVGVRGLLAALAGTSTALGAAAAAHASPVPATSAPQPAAPAASPASPGAAPATYVVRPGDSLWAIAARHLGPSASDAAIAAEWPRWYRANRAVIGDDPGLIHVGTRLAVPSPRRTGTSASQHHRPAHRDPGRSALTLDPDRR